MSSPPVMSGAIPSDGPAAVLRAVERRATTGSLTYSSTTGEPETIALVRGEPKVDDDASRAALERFLVLAEGTFEVHQRLPPLPVSRGDEEAREGRLGVHGVTDLLQYCDRVGLTGALFITSDDHHADFLYDGGELVAVRVFGEDDGEVQDALAWEDGGFRIEAWIEMPVLPAPSATGSADAADLGSHVVDAESVKLLKVVEVTLSSLLDDRADPAPPPVPAPVRARPDTRPPRADATVRVIYLGPPGAARRTKTPPPLSSALSAPPAAPVPPPIDRAKTEPDAARSDPTLLTDGPPFTPAPDRAPSRPKTQSYFREAGPFAVVAFALSAALFLAAIAYPFVLE
jgi:hypothetical protein